MGGIMMVDKIDEYLQHLRVTHAASSIQTINSILRNYARHVDSTKTLQENYDSYITLQKTKNSNNYAALCAIEIRQYLRYCGYDIESLCVPRKEKKTRKSLTQSEVEQLLEACKDDNYINARICIQLLLHTGLRVGELCNLRWNDIHYDSKYLTVTKGKGGKQRIVPLNNTAIETLHTQSKIQTDKKRSSDYVLSNRYGDKVTTRTVQYAIRQAGIRAGIKVTPHILRHTFATFCVQKGLDVSYLKEILGHESLNVTAEYLHHDFSSVQNAFEKIQTGD